MTDETAPVADTTEDMTLTVICNCEDDGCVQKAVNWDEFLHVLDPEDGVVPPQGSPMPLRVIFRGHIGRTKAAREDAKLRRVMAELARRGAARRVGKATFELPGMFMFRCAIEQ